MARLGIFTFSCQPSSQLACSPACLSVFTRNCFQLEIIALDNCSVGLSFSVSLSSTMAVSDFTHAKKSPYHVTSHKGGKINGGHQSSETSNQNFLDLTRDGRWIDDDDHCDCHRQYMVIRPKWKRRLCGKNCGWNYVFKQPDITDGEYIFNDLWGK